MNKRDELEETLSQKAGLLHSWKQLAESEAWHMYHRIMEDQKISRMILVGATPLNSLSDVPRQEFMKGEAAGIQTSISLPKVQIEMLEADITRLRAAIELENDNAEKTGEAAERGSRVDDDRFFGD